VDCVCGDDSDVEEEEEEQEELNQILDRQGD
jgi:hypothetical protein